MKLAIFPAVVVLVAAGSLAQTTRPAKSAAKDSNDDLKFMSTDQLMAQMARPTTNPSRPLDPLSDRPVQDKSSGAGAVKPDAPAVGVLREGTLIVDRLGRLTRGDKGQYEFTFESDGKALQDPPLIILPNVKLSLMEDVVANSSRDLRFRISGTITEYRGRNYILIEKLVVPPDVVQQF